MAGGGTVVERIAALVARSHHWPRSLRWSLVLALALLNMGCVLLAVQPLLWQRLTGIAALLVLLPALAYSRWALALCASGDTPMRAGERRYMREFVPAITAYTLLVLLSWPLLRHTQSLALRALLGVLPVLPIAFIVRAIVRYVIASDELEQRVQLVALAVAAGVVGMLSITAGFLAAAGVLHLDGSVLLWVLPVLLWVYALTRIWVTRRYSGE